MVFDFVLHDSQTFIHIPLEASQQQEALLEKDSDIHELRHDKMVHERKVSWIY